MVQSNIKNNANLTIVKKQAFWKGKMGTITPFLGLIFLFLVLFAATGGRVAGASNIQVLINQSYTLILLTAGLSFVYAHGGIDLSVGSVYALVQMAAGFIAMSTDNPALALIVGLVMGVFCSFLTGVISVGLNIPPFVSSLCMQFLGRGLVNTLLKNTSVVAPESLTQLNNWWLKTSVLIVVVVVLYILFQYTAIGKFNRAIGENVTAVKQSGINTKKHRIYAYLISGFMIGLAGFFGLARAGVMTTQTGLSLELDVIIALVLGGMSLSGGIKSSIRSGVVGSIITTLLSNGLILLGVVYTYVDGIKGLVFLAVVYLTYFRDKKGLLPR